MAVDEKILNCYYPGEKFPAISITGSNCALNCKHCGQHYLQNMLSAETPEKLKDICLKLSENGANGALLSGGCDEHGAVRFDNFVNVISDLKSETDLILNIHTGLITDPSLMEQLAKAGVDVASVDVVGDNDTIRQIYGLERSLKDYENGLRILIESGISCIVPHICIGQHFGELKGELKAIEILKNLHEEYSEFPNRIVFIVFIPTRDTDMEDVGAPSINDIGTVIENARAVFPEIPIILGCMRPKTTDEDRNIEIAGIKAGVNGIVLPSKKTLEFAELQGYKLNKYETCCAINR
jgi:uncharacterized radical SAM superfamily protein